MIIVGLTGNVASGKSTVAEHWRAGGVHVIDADQIGHRVVAEDRTVQEALVKEFGGGILDYGGRIDRGLLGAKAFATPEGVKRLNAIIHPPLIERLDAEIARQRQAKTDITVVDAALIFEFGLDEVLDLVVLVTAPREVRQERLLESRGMQADRIERIMEEQLPDEEKLADCDHVIVNDGSIERLCSAADAVLASIRESIIEVEREEEE